MENYLIDELNNLGYEYKDGRIDGVSSLSILAADLMKILSDRISNEYSDTHENKSQLQLQLLLQLHEAVVLSDEEKTKFPFTINDPFTFVISDHDIRRKTISDQLFPLNKYPVFANTPEYINILNNMFKLYDRSDHYVITGTS